MSTSGQRIVNESELDAAAGQVNEEMFADKQGGVSKAEHSDAQCAACSDISYCLPVALFRSLSVPAVAFVTPFALLCLAAGFTLPWWEGCAERQQETERDDRDRERQRQTERHRERRRETGGR